MKFVVLLAVLVSVAAAAGPDGAQNRPVKPRTEAWKLGLIGLALASFLIRKRL